MFSVVYLSEVGFSNDFQSVAGSCLSSTSSTQGNSGYFFSFHANVKGTYVLSFPSYSFGSGTISVYSQDCAAITCQYIASELDFSLDVYGSPYTFFLVNDVNSNPAFDGLTTVQISPRSMNVSFLFTPAPSNPTLLPAVSTVDIPALQPKILAMVIIYPIITVFTMRKLESTIKAMPIPSRPR